MYQWPLAIVYILTCVHTAYMVSVPENYMILDGILGKVIGALGTMDCLVKLGYRTPIAADERHATHVMSSAVYRPLICCWSTPVERTLL